MPPRKVGDVIVLPFPTKEAAENNVKLIRNPKAYRNIEVRENKEKGRWEVVLHHHQDKCRKPI